PGVAAVLQDSVRSRGYLTVPFWDLREEVGAMILVQRGKVQNGALVFETPLALPEGTEVIVRIDSADAAGPALAAQTAEEFLTQPFFGMWADREDMKDSVA